MPLVPLDIPAGFYKNGTDFEGSNRWQEGSLVRWLDGSLRPINGWRVRVDNITTDPVRGIHAWQDLAENAWIVVGAQDELVAITGGGDKYDIKPDDLVAGNANASVGIGYGNGPFGTGTFGQPRPVSTSSVPIPATSWDIDNFGEIMVACSVSDGRLLEWDLSYLAGSELVSNGTFASDTAWTKGSGWTISGGYAKYAGNTIAALSQTVTGLSDPADGKQDTHEIKVTMADPNTDEQTKVVTVVNVGGVNKYAIDGVTAPALTLYYGYTYIFDLSDSSNTSHPLIFQDGSGNPYTTNVVTTGTAGTTGAKVTITLPTSGTTVPATYLCQTHGAAMGNSITVTADPDTPAPVVKVTTGSTLVVNETLAVGENTFRFPAGATTALVEIEPSVTNSVDFWIETVSVKNVPVAEVIDNAPIDNLGLIVTEERFIFALGAGGNSRKISWCDKENRDVWTAAANNEAGDIELATSGQIMSAVRTRGSTLIITDFDCFQAVYQGPPYVYSFQRVGTNCGAISRKSSMATDLGVFYMGAENFFTFNGNTVSVLPCDVHDYVFGDFNYEQQSKVWGMVNGAHQECWWFYPSSGSTEVDRYVAFDFMEKHWLVGELSRTAGVPRGVFQYPLMCKVDTSHSDLMDHEVGNAYDSSSVFAETGPISIGVGDQIAKVNNVIPDEVTQGDVDLRFKTRFHPNDTERSYGPYNPANPTSVRFSGRQVRMRVDQDQAVDWRVGIMRLETTAGGRR